MADVKYDATGQQIEPVELTHVGGTAQTGRDLSLDLKALVDDSIKGLLRSIGDPGAAPLNTTGKTLLYNTAQVEAFLSYIRSALFLSDRTLATSTDKRQARIEVTLEITDRKQLERILASIKKISGLFDVERLFRA